MSSVASPSPVTFDLDVAESARLRESLILAGGGRMVRAMLVCSAAFQSLPPILRLYRYRGNDPFDWVLLALAFIVLVVMLAVFVVPARAQLLLLRPQSGTMVTFGNSGIELARFDDRGTRTTQRVPFSKIRTVRLIPGALFLVGRLKTIAIIPTRAFPDEGAAAIAFFEAHLVGTRMLQRSAARSTIVNTTSA